MSIPEEEEELVEDDECSSVSEEDEEEDVILLLEKSEKKEKKDDDDHDGSKRSLHKEDVAEVKKEVGISKYEKDGISKTTAAEGGTGDSHKIEFRKQSFGSEHIQVKFTLGEEDGAAGEKLSGEKTSPDSTARAARFLDTSSHKYYMRTLQVPDLVVTPAHDTIGKELLAVNSEQSVGSLSSCPTCKDLSPEDRAKRKHHHRKKRKHSSINQRRISGFKLKELDELRQRSQKSMSSLKEEEDNEHAEEINSHRFQDSGIRKHLLHRPVKSRRKSSVRKSDDASKVDRKPHEVFVELDELVSGEWKETARWIKFEEDVEESEKWGKPRVASLSFHSLLELRRTIEKGAVLLDMERNNLTDIASDVVEAMIDSNQIRADDAGTVLKVVMSKHKHLAPTHGLAYSISQASFSSFFSPSSAHVSENGDEKKKDVAEPLINKDIEAGKPPSCSSSFGGGGATSTRDAKNDYKIMKKIPEDAEATAVLVGCVDTLEQPTMAFVRLAEGVDLENVVALPIPVRFLFVLLGPSKEDFDYHEIGRSISTLMSDEMFHVKAYEADTRQDLLRAINIFLDDSIVLPPGQLENPELLRNISMYQEAMEKRAKKKLQAIEDDQKPVKPPEDPLKRTKRLFGGLIRDVKRRYPKYISDITDAFNPQCLAAFIFIYFAALSPAITFGGLLGEKTNGLMGVSEMLLGCCFCGCMFGLFSGQPLLIVGSTGPLLVFEEAVYNFCMSSEIPFLAARVWIGWWICIIAIVTVMFEGSFLIRFVTRFTQDIFTALIALIFIYETFKKLFSIYAMHPLLAIYPYPPDYNNTSLNCSVVEETISTANLSNSNITDVVKVAVMHPNTALLSTLLMFGTFMIAYFLRIFRNSKFLRSSVRRTIGDFGVPIAIFIMVVMDYLITDTYTQKLNIPSGISPTKPEERGWFISPFGPADNPLPVWMMFAAALPAFLVYILIFMESQITEMIVSKSERCLKKGTGFHLNVLVLGILNAVVSTFGLPWVCAAAIRSITHTNSLTMMSQTQAPGEKPKIDGVREQRVTVFTVNAALGLSILMGPILKEIPIAVLFGIFLYMGVTSLTGVQFVDRLELLFMPAKHYPDYLYVRLIKPLRIHIYTLVQLACLIALWMVKTYISIAFPFFLIMTIPVRSHILTRWYSKKEMHALDGDGAKPPPTSDTTKHK